MALLSREPLQLTSGVGPLIELLAHGRDGKTGAARDTELEEQPRNMRLDGLFADSQVLGDGLVGKARDDERQYLPFARGEAWGIRT